MGNAGEGEDFRKEHAVFTGRWQKYMIVGMIDGQRGNRKTIAIVSESESDKTEEVSRQGK